MPIEEIFKVADKTTKKVNTVAIGIGAMFLNKAKYILKDYGNYRQYSIIDLAHR